MSVIKLVVFGSSIFVSAFLLFQVQPLISKAILPWFGGSSAVWTAAMLFFQSILCAGYAYSHLMTRYLSRHWQAIFHLMLLGVATYAATGILPDVSLQPTGTEDPVFQIMQILIISVGLPYFALATTGPLLQHWLLVAGHNGSIYRLYALSNVGSLLALLSFPFYFERKFELGALGSMWSIGFAVFAALCVASAVMMAIRRTQVQQDALSSIDVKDKVDEDGSTLTKWPTRAAWVVLPALGSLAMVATTEQISHNIAPEPMLWITTLSLYLFSFILSFDHPRWYSRRWVAGLGLLGVLLICGQDDVAGLLGIDLELSMTFERFEHFVVMFLICLLCHGELFRHRPVSGKSLTAYYLSISVGGALGGLFVSLVATKFFKDYHEWTLLLILTMWLSLKVLGDSGKKPNGSIGYLASILNINIFRGSSFLVLSATIIYWNDPLSLRYRDYEDYKYVTLYQARNFFGVVEVIEKQYKNNSEKNIRFFRNGHITHGQQFVSPELQRLRSSYYSEKSGVGEALLHIQEKLPSVKVAIVGLGAGTMMNYARVKDQYDLFEINPEVIGIAMHWFTNIKNSEAGLIQYYLGDARVQLTGMKEPAKYNLIVLDAFTGDSVPIHLLTREAFKLYERHLAPGGMIAVHITNRYLNLYPIIKRQSQELGMDYRSRYLADDPAGVGRKCHYVILSKDQDYLNKYPSTFRISKLPNGSEGPVEPEIPKLPLWTDSYSSISTIEIKD